MLLRLTRDMACVGGCDDCWCIPSTDCKSQSGQADSVGHVKFVRLHLHETSDASMHDGVAIGAIKLAAGICTQHRDFITSTISLLRVRCYCVHSMDELSKDEVLRP